jgi:hypothetical protein
MQWVQPGGPVAADVTEGRFRLASLVTANVLAVVGAALFLAVLSRWRWLVEGASQQEVQTAYADWDMLASEPADTAGLGWPMNRTAPRWYRLHRQT